MPGVKLPVKGYTRKNGRRVGGYSRWVNIKRRVEYTTIKRGKVKVTSEKQHNFLHFRGMRHSHIVIRGGELKRYERH